MKISEEISKIKSVMINEKNFMVFLIVTLLNSILIEGGTVFATIPLVMIATFLLKIKYKDSKMIVINTFFSLFVVAIISEKIDIAAAMTISTAVSVYAGLMLHTISKYLNDKSKSLVKKIIKTTVCLVLIIFGLMINSVQYGAISTYMKAEKNIKNYVKEEYKQEYTCGNVYYNFMNNSYYAEVFNKNDLNDNGKVYFIQGLKTENSIYDSYKGDVIKTYQQDVKDALVVAINIDERLVNISKEDVIVNLNLKDTDYRLKDIFSYEDSINVNINLTTKYENIVEFNNYVFTLINKMKELKLKYNEIIIKSNIDEKGDTYYKLQIANGNFPNSLKEIEEISYMYNESNE